MRVVKGRQAAPLARFRRTLARRDPRCELGSMPRPRWQAPGGGTRRHWRRLRRSWSLRPRCARGAAMLEELADKTLRVLDRPAIPRPINFAVPRQEFFERSHVMAHRAIQGFGDRGRPSHDMIARKQSAFLRQGEGLMVHCVAGCLATA